MPGPLLGPFTSIHSFGKYLAFPLLPHKSSPREGAGVGTFMFPMRETQRVKVRVAGQGFEPKPLGAEHGGCSQA